MIILGEMIVAIVKIALNTKQKRNIMVIDFFSDGISSIPQNRAVKTEAPILKNGVGAWKKYNRFLF